ncbi:MAG: hypothetical protein AB7F19_02755 [Candidatus Babeliales bacterium]
MKKHLILSLLVASALAFNAQALDTDRDLFKGDDVYGQTFFSVRPEFESAFPEKTVGFRDRAKARCDGHGGAFQFVPFGGRSTKSKDLMKYFSPGGQTTLVVDSNPDFPVNGIGSQSDVQRDINPIHFGINYTLNGEPGGPAGRFRSVIQFRPERTVGGLGITYRQYVGRNCDCDDRTWWFEISAPILHVRNKMNLTETLITTSGEPVDGGGILSPANMTEAFTGAVEFFGTGTRMSFGLINDLRDNNNQTFDGIQSPKSAMRAWGSDIELKLGRDWYTSDCVYMGGYVGLHIPASRKPNGRYVFEAIPGFNQHFGFMTGLLAGVEIWRDCDRSLSWEFETNHRFWIQNTQVRSFDLKNRPWSRYMIVRREDGEIAPGINMFTRQMKVHPRYSFDINTGLVYGNDCGFSAELGYNFWARQGERVKLKEPFPPANLGLVGFDDEGNIDPDFINRLSNIGDNNTGANYPLITLPDSGIRPQDLNLLSAAAPACLSNTIYGALGYAWDDRCYPLFVGLGGSYEFSGKNTALNRWLVWGKFGVSI